MNIGDIIGLMGQIAPVIREYTENALKPALARVEAAEQAIKGFRVPQDGKSVTAEDVAPLIAAEVQRCLGEMNVAKAEMQNNIGLAGALIDRDGNLVVTFSNGDTKELGRVVGKDVDPAAVEHLIAEKVAAIPAPRDGADGVGFDDLYVIHDGARGFTLKFSKGDRVKEFPFSLPVVLDKGVYKADEEYEPGDGVTYAGSFWIAQEKTAAKPDSGNGWRLAVKRGRDGKSPEPPSKSGPVRIGPPSKDS